MKNISRLLLMTTLFLFIGCVHSMLSKRDSLLITGNYGELQKHTEEEAGRSETANTSILLPLCISYGKTKRYDRLFECCNRLENNILKGDICNIDREEAVKRNPLLGVNAKLSTMGGARIKCDVSPFPHILRAEAYIDLGQYEKAVEEARKAYQMSTTYRVWSMSSLSLAYALQGNREEALRIAEELDAASTPLGLASQKNVGLAKTYLALKEFPKASSLVTGLDFSGEGLFAWQKLPRLFMSSKCLMETGKITEAKAGYDDLLKMSQTRDNGGIYWMILYDLGRIAEQEGNLKEAISFYRRAIAIIEEQRSTINTETSKIGFVGDKQEAYRRLVFALYADGQYAAAFEYVERAKSRALVDMLAAKQDFSVTTGDRQAVADLLAQNAVQEKELLAQDETSNRSQTRSVVIKNREHLLLQSPELASLVSVTSLGIAEIQDKIPQEETLVEYYYDNKDILVFVLSVQGLKVFKLNGDEIAETIQQFRKLLINPYSNDYLAVSRKLYSRLIQPVETSLGNRNLIIVPHGALHYLPFNALHDGQGYLIERYSIRMLPSASVIKYLQTKISSKPAGILAFGNPDLGDPRQDLVYARSEALAVAQTRLQSKVLLGKDATETAFKRYGSGFQYIHFATHGQFNADTPLKSAILLAKDAENDGILTVDKLYSIRLDADLITLSACETGMNKIANGDDIIGLTRGFLYSGSSSIVASLWKVDDLATSDLMVQFYTNMKTLDKREALRRAQLQTKKKYDHPFYWTSFQLTGNAQ
jgi:CHAT domain-containing protein